MAVEQNLSAVWEQIVRGGHIRSRFRGFDGQEIESGVRMTATGPRHYATNVETGQEIRAAVMERPINGSNFTILWNQFRSLKPHAKQDGLGRQRDYSPEATDCLFACQDEKNPLSLLRRHIPVQMTLRNFQWAALPNALPVDQDGHFLWVPFTTSAGATVFPHQVQTLTLPFLQDFLALAAASSNLLTFFNSMHAGASVNHIHFHSVHRGSEMPLEKAAIIRKADHYLLSDYPASGIVYPVNCSPETIWLDVKKMQEHGIPLNLIHAGSRTFLIPRDVEHEVVVEFPRGILAGMELSGKPITTDRSFYENADWQTIQKALRIRPSAMRISSPFWVREFET